jgi:enoyl-CoA hydratase/carnithine racemase
LVSLTKDCGVVILALDSPILSRDALHQLAATLDLLANRDEPAPLVLASNHPTIFLAGADLAEIAELDATGCVPYARLGRSAATALDHHPAPVVAAVDGSCSGGGFDLVLACDVVVASDRATFSHPGVFRGLVTGWSGTSRLPRCVGTPMAKRLFLEGSSIDAAGLADTGVVVEVAPDPRRTAVEVAARLHRLPPDRLGLWRALRGSSFIDRFRALVVEKS